MKAGLLDRFESEPQHEPVLAHEVFAQHLAEIRKGRIYQMPDFAALMRHDGLPPQFDTGLEEGLYVDPVYLPEVAHAGPPDRFSFTRSMLLDVGREDSRHEVFFGDLTMTWFRLGQMATKRVAVKPAGSATNSPIQGYQSALQEAAVQQYADDLGIPTIKPAGLLVVPGNVDVPYIYKIANFEHGLRTLDNVNWNRLSPEERWERFNIAIDFLAQLHSELIFHGDPAFKNIGFGQGEGEYFLVDPEDARSARELVHPSAQGMRRLHMNMLCDLNSVVLSVNKHIVGSLPPEQRPTGQDLFELHVERVYIPYFERLVRINSPYVAILTQELNEIIQHKLDETMGA